MTEIAISTAPRKPWLSERMVIGFISVALGLAMWELVMRFGLVPRVLFAAPSATFDAFVQLVATGELQKHLLVTGHEFIVGLVLAIVAGLPVAILAGWYQRLGWAMQPLIAALYAMPTVALFPLIIIFFGIEFWDKVLLVFLSGFLQLYVAVSAGVRATDRRWVRLARSFRAGRRRLFWSIVIPGAVPFILLGLRLAVGRALVNVVVAEMLASQAGIGYMISYYGNNFQIADVFVALISVTALGVVLNQMLLWAESYFERWRPVRE